jgi:hypothetical protein
VALMAAAARSLFALLPAHRGLRSPTRIDLRRRLCSTRARIGCTRRKPLAMMSVAVALGGGYNRPPWSTHDEFAKLALTAPALTDRAAQKAFQARPNSPSTACRSAPSPTASGACATRARRPPQYVLDPVPRHRTDG